MDLHRCRFIQYPPSAINTLAFSHSSSTKSSSHRSVLRLAIGRGNGDIEIWNPQKGAWVQETVLRGGSGRSVESLVWTQDIETESSTGEPISGKLRLFSTGYSTAITEWDLTLGRPLRHSNGDHGTVWCIAAQPRNDTSTIPTKGQNQPQHHEQSLVAACGDGSLVLHSTADGDLQFTRTLPRPSNVKARAMSLAFQNRTRIAVGYSDSMIRLYDISGHGKLVRNMSLGAGPDGKSQEIMVLTIKCLPDGTIVSGDSTGEIKIWDFKTLALVQRIKGHENYVLSLVVSIDGQNIMSGGSDRRTVLYRRKEQHGRQRWENVSHRRFHQNDVKTMASFEDANMSVVVSGGSDTVPIVVPFREFGDELHISLPSFPQLPPVKSASIGRYLLCWWDREVHIWLVKKSSKDFQDEADDPKATKQVARLEVQGEDNINSVSINSSGSMVAVSTTSSVKAFALQLRNSPTEYLRVRKINVPDSLSSGGAKLLEISPDSKWLLVVRMDNSVHMYRIDTEIMSHSKLRLLPASVELHRREYQLGKPKRSQVYYGTHGDYSQSITRISWSSDSSLVVTGDLSGQIDAWVLSGEEDHTDPMDTDHGDKTTPLSEASDDEDGQAEVSRKIYGQIWEPLAKSLPRLPSAPLLLSFRPGRASVPMIGTNGHSIDHSPSRATRHDLMTREDRLLAVTSTHEVLEYKVLEGKLSAWSQRNPPSMLPDSFKIIRARAMGCVWDINSERERLWLYGSHWMFMFDLSRDFPAGKPLPQSSTEMDSMENHVANKKRKRNAAEQIGEALANQRSGAGGRVPAEELSQGFGRGVLKVHGSEREWASFDRPRADAADDDTDDMSSRVNGGTISALTQLRRGTGAKGTSEEGHTAENVTDRPDESNAAVKREQPRYWTTFEYRPILGIVPMNGGPERGGGNEEDDGLEVALVERPLWDADLAPRWEGNQEWNRDV